MRALVLTLVALSSGCSLTALEEDSIQPTQNVCKADTDCTGGVCNTTLGVCASTDGTFPSILLEVTPPASVKGYGGIGFLKNATGLSPDGGPLAVDIDFVAKVSGSVEPTKGNYTAPDGDCVIGYGKNKDRTTAPVKLTFTPTARLIGLPTPQYVTTSDWNPAAEKYEFEAWMPADTYDVYIEAFDHAEDPIDSEFQPGSCALAPQFVYPAEGTQWEVPAGDYTIPFVLQPPSLLSVTVPSPVDLQGWTVDIVHPGNGRVLSAPVTLKKLAEGKYVADVEYTKLPASAEPGTEVVRIRPTPCPAQADPQNPCEAKIGPTLVVERRAVELSTEGEALVDQLANLDVGEMPVPTFPTVTLKDVSLTTSDGFYSGEASVRFVSKEQGLDLKDQNGPLKGVQAFFDRTVTSQNGKFDVTLLPGDYDVYVAPTVGGNYATTHAELLVTFQGAPGASTNEQGGKTIELEPVSLVGGRVVTSADEAAVGAEVQAVASAISPSPLLVAVGATPFKPQALSGSVDQSGGFVLNADPGTLDFSVRPADGTSFPWLVRPNVEVQSGTHDLGKMQIAWPVIYSGSVSLPNGVEAGSALIRAYIYLNEAGYAQSRDGATGVLQIAETRADENGAFRLFLPPHLN